MGRSVASWGMDDLHSLTVFIPKRLLYILNNMCRLQKGVEGSMAELGQGAFPRCATRQTCGAYLSLQQEVIQLLDLKRRLQLKQASM